ncbi:hypothetical protein Purlil1_4811 [Purpureocillium lilacinum]|uniref:Uncharacterized protein n=1 Tax=Purpureocillium lilacinum TaxID=33203 RepID=A0ABR0C396_PURLI|nr:hypothetical protein Purlil1_4811 [Purpureocillium lilacinum]
MTHRKRGQGSNPPKCRGFCGRGIIAGQGCLSRPGLTPSVRTSDETLASLDYLRRTAPPDGVAFQMLGPSAPTYGPASPEAGTMDVFPTRHLLGGVVFSASMSQRCDPSV